jgi:hypothetical protein
LKDPRFQLKTESKSYMADRNVPNKYLARLRLVCLELPEVVEEQAWAGIRWCVRRKNFAQVLMIHEGWPPAYSRAASTRGPACVLTFRLSRENCAALRFRRAPFFRPPWFPNIAGVLLDEQSDWDEIDTLLRVSYRVLAPRKLAAFIE